MTPEQLFRKYECELSFEYFTRYFFKVRYGEKMIIGNHHKVFFDVIEKVYNGTIKRLIVNVPPGFTKTEIFVISFIAWGIAINPQSRFMHLSSSDALALENSSKTRELINSEEYQLMWPIKMKDDSDSKKKWWTEQSGGMYAASAGGQVTGFRAGHMIKTKFTGALIYDDPNKPDDAFTVELEKTNRRVNNTIKSRLAHEDIPVIVIMQRIHKDDVSGYLLKGGTKESWYHLNLPVYIENSKEYNKDYGYGIQIKHNIKDGWLWEEKLNETHKNSLMSHKLTFFSQYMQDPEKIDITGALWKQEVIDKYRLSEIPRLKILTYAQGVDPSGDDGISKTADAIGDVIAAVDQHGDYYVIHDGTMNGSPQEWATSIISNYHKFRVSILIYERNFGGAMIEHTLRSVSGGDFVRMMEITASRGKLVRAEPISALYEQGKVHHVGYFPELENELCTFNGTGKSPNRLDALVWCLTYLHDYVVNCGFKSLGAMEDFL